jgi:gamma-glutamyl-gamma-aminobutyrate hydrolase PuuD
MTNKRKKRMSQEDLELAYHRNVIEFPSEGPMPVRRSGSELEHDWNSGVDALGRVNRRTFPALDDEIPDFLKESAVKKPPENPQEHRVPDNDPLAGIQTRPVQLLKDHTLDFPLLGFSVFVQPDPDVPDDEARYAKMFARTYSKRAKSVLEADLVIFSGGSDVNPALYGEERHETTLFDTQRDETDIALYNMCIEHGIPMFGVCRGAQFGSVMNKGKLFQNVDHHYGDHPMWDIKRDKPLEKVSSVHHQMVQQNTANGMQIIATSARSTKRQTMVGKNECTAFGTNADIEAFFYRDSCFLGVQGHPEYGGYNYYTVWCLDLIQEFIYENPDLDWTDGNLRMKPDLRLERTALANLPKIELSAGKEVK